MAVLIGREREREILQTCLESRKSEFVVVFGRRRVGKTYLVNQFFNGSFSFYATGTPNGKMRDELRVFEDSLYRYTGRKVKLADWIDAFSALRDYLESGNVQREFQTGKRVVFIDELPWLDTPRSSFKAALDYFWNSWASNQEDLIMIVCGSATSWIMNNVIYDTGGLYNRITRQIFLAPFTLKECEQMLEVNGLQYSRHQIIECYMVFGGIPYYLDFLDKRLSLTQNIDALFFKPFGQLRNEYQRLYSSLFRNYKDHIGIVETLFRKKTGMTREEIINESQIKNGGTLTKILRELEECGFIRSYSDFTKAKSGRVFQLVDALSLFYLTFVNSRERSSWLDFIGTPKYYSWCGYAFERVCLLHTDQITEALRISGMQNSVCSWKSRNADSGAQIDLLIDRKDNVVNVCEIKFASEPYAIDKAYGQNLIHKIETFRTETGTRKALFLTFISSYGLVNNKYRNIVVNELRENDLFL